MAAVPVKLSHWIGSETSADGYSESAIPVFPVPRLR
jgi:hypothetical protein